MNAWLLEFGGRCWLVCVIRIYIIGFRIRIIRSIFTFSLRFFDYCLQDALLHSFPLHRFYLLQIAKENSKSFSW